MLLDMIRDPFRQPSTTCTGDHDLAVGCGVSTLRDLVDVEGDGVKRGARLTGVYGEAAPLADTGARQAVPVSAEAAAIGLSVRPSPDRRQAAHGRTHSEAVVDDGDGSGALAVSVSVESNEHRFRLGLDGIID